MVLTFWKKEKALKRCTVLNSTYLPTFVCSQGFDFKEPTPRCDGHHNRCLALILHIYIYYVEIICFQIWVSVFGAACLWASKQQEILGEGEQFSWLEDFSDGDTFLSTSFAFCHQRRTVKSATRWWFEEI